MKKLFILPAIFIFIGGLALGQADTIRKEEKRSNCEQQALGDLFRKKGKAPKPPKKIGALILPNISSNPTNGLILGVGGSLGWYMGPKEHTKVSSAGFTAAVTSKNQLITFIKSNIYTKENRFYLQGDWKFYIYSQPTYGLGTNSPDTASVPSGIHWMGEGVSDESVLFAMEFNYVKIHEIVNRQIVGELYAGLGYHLDYYYAIVDTSYHAATSTTPELQTPHHYYSVKNEFSTEKYLLSGVSLNLVYDTRDNQISPYKGMYANINYRINPTFLGSDQFSTSLWLEYRAYKGLSKKTPRHLIGFWTFVNFNLSGKLPYLTMPSLGDDQRARSGRGYTNGRYRGDNLLYAEAEYRFPISQCTKILGGVLFVNAVTASNRQNNVDLFQYIKPAVGIGIRVMVNKYFRTNINLDYAIGSSPKDFIFRDKRLFKIKGFPTKFLFLFSGLSATSIHIRS